MTQTSSIMNDDTFSRDNCLSDVSDKTMISWSGKKEGDSIATALPIQTMGISEKTTIENVELTSTERQELQAKRAKLIGMRDEVSTIEMVSLLFFVFLRIISVWSIPSLFIDDGQFFVSLLIICFLNDNC